MTDHTLWFMCLCPSILNLHPFLLSLSSLPPLQDQRADLAISQLKDERDRLQEEVNALRCGMLPPSASISSSMGSTAMVPGAHAGPLGPNGAADMDGMGAGMLGGEGMGPMGQWGGMGAREGSHSAEMAAMAEELEYLRGTADNLTGQIDIYQVRGQRDGTGAWREEGQRQEGGKEVA